MVPTLKTEDRIFVDIGHKVPSPDGLHVLCDGRGMIVKRVKRAAIAELPRLRVISDNPHHKAYEVTVEEARIIGRVAGILSLA